MKLVEHDHGAGVMTMINDTTRCPDDGAVLERENVEIKMAKAEVITFDAVNLRCPLCSRRTYPAGVLRLIEAVWADSDAIRYG